MEIFIKKSIGWFFLGIGVSFLSLGFYLFSKLTILSVNDKKIQNVLDNVKGDDFQKLLYMKNTGFELMLISSLLLISGSILVSINSRHQINLNTAKQN